MTATIWWDAGTNCLILESGIELQSFSPNVADYTADREDVEGVLLSDLAIALTNAVSPKKFHEATFAVCSPAEKGVSPRSRAAIRGRHDEQANIIDIFDLIENERLSLLVTVPHPVARTADNVYDIIGPLLDSREIEIISVRYVEHGLDYTDTLEVYLTTNTRWRIWQALDLAEIVRLALGFSHMDPRSPLGAYLLLTTGSPDALLGQPESVWLEVKQKCNIESELEQHNFASHLASLANTDQGGLFVIGMRTSKNEARQDVISEVPGCRPGSIIPEIYAKVAKSRVVPNIEGAEFELIQCHEKHLLAIRIPPQPDYLKPFIVRRGITVNGYTYGASITIPYREGDRRWNLGPEAVHSLLVAARIALKQQHST